jgi:hypothetical protein
VVPKREQLSVISKTQLSERRKQGKSRFDTFRRDEQPDAEDIRLEDIHFANFLGSKCEEGIPYNNVHINEPVNIIECDIYLKPEPSKNVAEEAAPQEEDGEYVDSFVPQIKREPNCVWNMNWIYEPDTKTLSGYSTFKRGHDGDVDEEPAKRMRSEIDTLSRMEEGLLANEMQQEENNFAAMVEYMKQQVALAQQMMADELTPCDCCR